MIWYQIINFVILAAILGVFGIRIALKIYREHKKDVSTGLAEAEEGLRKSGEAEKLEGEIRVEAEKEAEKIREISSADIEKIRAAADEGIDGKLAAYRQELEREYEITRRDSFERIRRDALGKVSGVVKEIVSREPYLSRLRTDEGKIVDSIIPLLRITPGDRAYLLQHDVLYVTLLSAFALDQRMIDKVESTIINMLAAVGGKPSFRVLVDPALLGGLQVRIGDTVYDGTVKNFLYKLTASLSGSDEVYEEGNKSSGMLIDLLEKQIEEHSNHIDIYQRGRVVSVSDGICWLDGLADIMYGELVEFDCGERGMVLDIEEGRIGCVVFGEYQHLQEYSRVRRLGKMASVGVGDRLLGRVLGPLGEPIDGKGSLHCRESRPIESPAPGIIDRSPVNEPLYTGIKVIDALIPIGKGQRELIIGDRQTGKSAIAVDTIINQKGKNVICIYVAIGQKEATVAGIAKKLEASGAMDYTVIVSANASSTAPMLYVAPYSGTAIGEYFMNKGRDVLIVYDDLSKHAVAYREMSLLLHRPSGREAYPGDVFYLHSRLLERSAHLSEERGGGSMTALPLIETQAGDISAYIPTNVISITDGQIFLESSLFNEGQRPAVNVGLSVSRVGGSAQTKLMRRVSGNLRVNLAQYRELLSFAQFGSELDDATSKTLAMGARVMEILKQKRYAPMPLEKQVLILYVVSNGIASEVPVASLSDYEKELFSYFEKSKSGIMSALATGAAMTAELAEDIEKSAAAFTEDYLCRVSEV